jgi:hypothetical protein
MDLFSHTPRFKNEKKIKDNFWGIFGGTSWKFIIINLFMMPKTN